MGNFKSSASNDFLVSIVQMTCPLSPICNG